MTGRPTRILCIVSQLGFGGAERQTYELLRAMQSGARYRPEVLCLSNALEPFGRLLRELGLDVHVLPRSRSFDWGRVRALRREIRRRAPDLVHAVHYEAAAYAHLAMLRLRSPPLLPSIRSTVIRPKLSKRLVYRAMLRSAPLVVANSVRGGEYVVDYFGADPDRLRVIGNGLDFDELDARASQGASLREELGLAEGTPLVAFVGKDSKHKNVRRFLEVFARLRSRDSEVHAALVGWKLGPGDRERLGVDDDHVHLLGVRDDVPSIMRQIDLLVMTSNTEGCPNTLIEAAALGTPALAPDVGDCARILAPFAERLVTPSQDPDDYVRLARPLLEGCLGDADRSHLAAHARKEYSLARMVEETLAAYEALVDPPCSGA